MDGGGARLRGRCWLGCKDLLDGSLLQHIENSHKEGGAEAGSEPSQRALAHSSRQTVADPLRMHRELPTTVWFSTLRPTVGRACALLLPLPPLLQQPSFRECFQERKSLVLLLLPPLLHSPTKTCFSLGSCRCRCSCVLELAKVVAAVVRLLPRGNTFTTNQL